MAKQVLVIEAGPAGLEAARAAAMAGAWVTLVSEGPLGGRAGWDSLIYYCPLRSMGKPAAAQP
jgi:dihydrolipoamide dehydrogenase